MVATPLLLRPQGLRPLLCDSVTSSPVSPKDWSFSQYERDARNPVVSRGRVNPKIWRQISTGSILGLVGGLAVSVFSKPLALLIGLLVFGVQFIESRGIHIIPYNSIQKYFKRMDLRSAMQDNVALKLSFGATFALAGFAEF
ncbi:uncharacterized protein K452DRAFT_226078 [Aplosporella prunicola CBS 121167]|uniref:FUN14 domain-containing protein n=1 Tax=Aplosporella prunicola CBS 121167 TaxID=1176127 RepID=A0A6A6BHD9_9PEZI|nr:uncharacterized protein K452DRAFT_226078 [Aplosporella prunicola CBS 121167]KAF2142863.1 hypothetical protein K452DRAFT_226078 [Aplosporella prunicola CBS 121167]